ncbi:MAG TPA: hypothetical protein VIL55_02030 [Naasia sp.]
MTSRTASRTASLLLAGAALALTVPLLAGCQAFGVNEQYGASYSTVADMEDSWDSARIPRLVPADAEKIRIGYNTIDEGAMLAFTSNGVITADYCEPGAVDGAPAFEPRWWPADELPGEGYTCGDWTVVEVDGEYLVWD